MLRVPSRCLVEVIQAVAALGVLLDGDAEYIMSASIIRGVEMLKFLMYAAIPLVVSACTTFGGIEKNIEQKYLGKPIDAAIDGLGFPAAERTIAGRKLYTWTVGRSQPNLIAGPNGTLMVSGATSLSCTLNLEVDSQEVVKRYSYDGQLGACAAFGN